MINKPKYFFIDIDPLAQPNLTGVGRATNFLTREISNRLTSVSGEVELVYADPLGRRPINLDESLLKNPKVHIRRALLMFRKVYGKLLKYNVAPPFNLLIPSFHKYQAALYPNFARFPMWPRTNSFTVIHDLTYLKFPEQVEAKNLSYLKKIVPRAVKKSTGIICLSETTKQEIIEEFNIPENKIIITPLLPEKLYPESTSVLNDLDLTAKNYIIFVGTLEPRKNLPSLLDAYLLLKKEMRQKYPVVMVGPKGWNDEELIKKIDQTRAAGGNIITTGFVSEEDKIALLANAGVFVLPAFYEGFGIPPAEAMQQGCPVILSDIPVLRETAGEAALFCDPHNPKNIADVITKLLSDENLQAEYSKRGKERIVELTAQFNTACDDLVARMVGTK